MAVGCGRTATDVLLQALAEHDPTLHDHVLEVAELARTVAWMLALSGEDRDLISRAAELHDRKQRRGREDDRLADERVRRMFEVRRCAGTQFDPMVVRAFCAARRAAPVTA